MKTIVESRASIIIYNIILSNNIDKGIVLLPANICPIVPATLYKAKTKFEFVDISEKDYSIDIDLILNRVQNAEDISSILVSDTYGVELEREDFFAKIKMINDKILIIHDRCLNIPYTESRQTLADVVLHSTGYSKYIDLSYGGFGFIQKTVDYNSRDIKFIRKDHDELVKSFNNVFKNKIRFGYQDTNWLGDSSLKIDKENYFKEINDKFDSINSHKKILNKIYSENINSRFQLGNCYNNWRFNLLVNNKNLVLNKIFENNLFASSHYQSLVGIFGNGLGIKAENLHAKIINLFNDFRFTEKKAYLVSEIVNRYAE